MYIPSITNVKLSLSEKAHTDKVVPLSLIGITFSFAKEPVPLSTPLMLSVDSGIQLEGIVAIEFHPPV